MNNFIKKFVNKSKGPLSYINDLTDVIWKLWGIFVTVLLLADTPLTTNIKNFFFDLNIFLKIILFLLLPLSFLYLIYDAYKKIKFIYESNTLSVNLERERVKITSGQLIKNYKSIIPSTTIIREIYKDFEKKAKRWSSDSYLADLALYIWVKKSKIDTTIEVEFFSKKKEANIKFKTIGMKIPQKSTIMPNQISYDTYRVEGRPFFLEKKWRRFVVEGLERIENEIAGHEFYLSIGNMGGIVRFYLDPGFIPLKTFAFYLSKGIMYKDFSLEEKITLL